MVPFSQVGMLSLQSTFPEFNFQQQAIDNHAECLDRLLAKLEHALSSTESSTNQNPAAQQGMLDNSPERNISIQVSVYGPGSLYQ